MSTTEPGLPAPLTEARPRITPPGALNLTGGPLQKRLSAAVAIAGPLALYHLNRAGRSGAAGAGMILFAAIFFFSVILPQQRELISLNSQLTAARHPTGTAEAAPVRVSKFMDALPARADLPKVVGQVFALASTAGVTLERGRYELIPLRKGNLAQYRMVFPVKGSYPDIRKLIDSVLLTIPAAAVEGMRIERKGVGETTVSADLRFSIFVRNTP